MQMNLPTWPTHGPMRGLPVTARQRRRIDRCAAWRDDSGSSVAAGDVRDDAREIADDVARVEQAGLFLPGRSVTKKFH